MECLRIPFLKITPNFNLSMALKCVFFFNLSLNFPNPEYLYLRCIGYYNCEIHEQEIILSPNQLFVITRKRKCIIIATTCNNKENLCVIGWNMTIRCFFLFLRSTLRLVMRLFAILISKHRTHNNLNAISVAPIDSSRVREISALSLLSNYPHSPRFRNALSIYPHTHRTSLTPWPFCFVYSERSHVTSCFFCISRWRAKNSKEKRRLRLQERIITSLLCDESGHRARTSVHISLACHTHIKHIALFGGSRPSQCWQAERARMKEILPTQNAQTDTANATAVFFSPQTFFHACCSQLNHKVVSASISNRPHQSVSYLVSGIINYQFLVNFHSTLLCISKSTWICV